MGSKWPCLPMGNLVEKIAMGPFGSNIKVETFVESGVPIISGAHLKGFTLEEVGYNYITEQHANNLKNSNVFPGDVIFTHAGTVGQCAMIPFSAQYERYVVSQRQFYARCDRSKLLPEFATYYFHTPEGHASLLANVNSTGVPSIAQPSSYLKTILIPVPPITEQKKIVHIVQTLNKTISINQKQNDYLEHCLVAIYKDLFSHSEAWPKGTLSDVGTIVGGATPLKKQEDFFTDNGIGWITPRDLANNPNKFIAHGGTDITEAGYASCSAKLMPKGSVLFSSRAPIGYIAIASAEVCTNQGFKSVVPYERYGTAFVYSFLKDNVQAIKDAGSGTTFAEVSGSTMKGVPLRIPPERLCADFEQRAQPILHLQKNNEDESRTLSNLRDSLLPKLISGEIDVSKVVFSKLLNNHLSGCSS